MSAQLQDSFEQFAQFGSSKNNLSQGTTMDNAHFAKMCRDAKVLGKSVTTVDVDLVFKKVLIKGERRINFDQFKAALEMLAAQKYPDDASASEKVFSLIAAATPAQNGTQADASGIYSKLTDTSLYTGSHKLRFDADGKGRGIEGRDQPVQTSDLSQIVNRKSGTAAATTGGKRSPTASMEKINGSKAANTATSNKNLSGKSTGNLVKSNKNLSASPAGQVQKSNKNLSVENSLSAAPKSKSGDVYDRLTNTSGYTGSHKERFDANGNGKGLAGRT